MDNNDSIVIKTLVDYYRLCSTPDDDIEYDEELLRAIERVLEDFMTKEQFDEWKKQFNT